ncbi:MAG: putative Ig domain-containing protein, partial [Planctomycetaceae bacterium]
GTGFTQLFSTDSAFAALKSDGSIVSWGNGSNGGSGAPAGTSFRTIQSIKNIAAYFDPSQATAFTAPPGAAFSQTVRVVSLDTVTYSVSAGSLPTGLSLNPSTG